ncbi:hypothetical protein C7M84_019759 [Penaeus vannamei]|uniref:Uncharacterized protein n=1 Tax=Penaeus vannamei TaxID=6689 RepID=A0A423U952_PENVA|nr:hypothetical protein C7M84_019759 [Penaeus vannamei]
MWDATTMVAAMLIIHRMPVFLHNRITELILKILAEPLLILRTPGLVILRVLGATLTVVPHTRIQMLIAELIKGLVNTVGILRRHRSQRPMGCSRERVHQLTTKTQTI